MDLADLIAGLRRRWWAGLLGIVGTAFLLQYVYSIVPLQYQDQAAMLLLPPASALEKSTNPYLGLGGLQAATDVLARAVSTGAVHDTLAPKDGTAAFEVVRDTSGAGPVVVIDATDTTSDGAQALLGQVAETVPKVLLDLQNAVGVTPAEQIRVVEIARSSTPTVDNKTQFRALLLSGVGGLALTLFGVSALDSLMRRRSDGGADPAAFMEGAVSAALDDDGAPVNDLDDPDRTPDVAGGADLVSDGADEARQNAPAPR